MELRALRYFVAVAEARSFTRASETLHIAQPALSRQIQQLEASLGVRLLQRNSRPLRLTDAGRLFHEQAVQVLARVEQLRTSTRQLALNQRTTLSIGFVASTLYGGLPELVRRLRALRPEVDVRLLELTSLQQIEALKEGRIDVGFGRVRIEDAAVERLVLREERLVVAAPRGSALASDDRPLRIHELAGQPLLVYPSEPRPSFADTVLRLFQDHGVRPARVQEVRELQSALGLVAADSGICVVPESARLRSDVHYRPIADSRATSPIILSHRSQDEGWYVGAILTLLRQMYAETPSLLGGDGMDLRLALPWQAR